MSPLSILIVGSGVAGPTLASFLLLSPLPPHEKPHITIVERASSSRAKGQNIDIRGAGVTIIRKLGLETAIRSSTTGEEGVHFVDSGNRIWAAFGADRSGKIQTGTSDIEILRGSLADICYRRCKTISDEAEKEGAQAVEFILGDYLDELDQDDEKVSVHFAKSGRRRTFDLVVGADGLQSQTRNMIWGREGEKDRLKRLGMYGGFFSMPSSETDSAWRRWFHAPGRRAMMVRPSGTKGTSTVFLFVVNENDDRLEEVAVDGRKGVQAQKALFKEYFHDAGWECERIVREMEAADDFYYDMVAQVKMKKWSKGRVVLLGDAGYCGSPISGMGTTLALSGAYNLAGALVRHPSDHTAAFAEYQEKMRPVVDRAQKLVPGAPHIFCPETSWGIFIMHTIQAVIYWSGVVNLISKFAGPPAGAVPVEEYGFRIPQEMK